MGVEAELELFDDVVDVGFPSKLANNDHLYFNGSDIFNLYISLLLDLIILFLIHFTFEKKNLKRN